MTMLHQLKSGEIARIIKFENASIYEKQFISNGVKEGSIIRVISSFGLITFSVNSKLFSISHNIAKHVRVISLRIMETESI